MRGADALGAPGDPVRDVKQVATLLAVKADGRGVARRSVRERTRGLVMGRRRIDDAVRGAEEPGVGAEGRGGGAGRDATDYAGLLTAAREGGRRISLRRWPTRSDPPRPGIDAREDRLGLRRRLPPHARPGGRRVSLAGNRTLPGTLCAARASGLRTHGARATCTA
jgi:hypothetical protein